MLRNAEDLAREIEPCLSGIEAEARKEPEEVNRLKIDLLVKNIRLIFRRRAGVEGCCDNGGNFLKPKEDAMAAEVNGD